MSPLRSPESRALRDESDDAAERLSTPTNETGGADAIREAATYDRRMAIGVQREVLAGMLRSHGEDDLAERALLLTDDELKRIGELGAHYAFSKRAEALGGSMGGTRALSLATIDVLENTGRDLRWSRTEGELRFGSADEWTEVDVARDRALRVHASPEPRPPSDA